MVIAVNTLHEMARKLFLLGAPPNSELLETACRELDISLPPFERLYPDPDANTAYRTTEAATSIPTWRKLMPEVPAFEIDSQSQWDEPSRVRASPQTQAFDSSPQLSAEYLDTTYTQYMTQNVNDLPSSLMSESVASSDASYNEDRSFVAANLDMKGLSKLSSVPSARKLQSLYPQTVSICAIVAVISIDGPRTVTTRYGNEMEIVNMVVGDDTRSGFGITFWLTSPNDTGHGRKKAISEASKKLRATVLAVRMQDILYMSNIALTIFKDKVYGTSMRCDRTSVHILHRIRRLEREDDRYRLPDDSAHSLVQAATVVLRWCVDFVGWEHDPEPIHKRQKLDSQTDPASSSAASSWMPHDTVQSLQSSSG